MLIPDKLEDDADSHAPKLGVFATTLVVFFLAEMGDKTQIATVMLTAKYEAYATRGGRHHTGYDAGQRAGRVAGRTHLAEGAAAYRAPPVGTGFRAAGRAGICRHALMVSGPGSDLLYFPGADLLSLRALKKYR